MIAFIVGLVVGYVLAIPPGPIGMASARVGLRNGASAARMLALGAGLFDVVYCFLAMTASASLASLLDVSGPNQPLFTGLAMTVAGAIVVVGIYQFRNPVKIALDSTDENTISRRRPFFTGIAYAIANLANPSFIPSLLVMSAYIMALGLVSNEDIDQLMFSIGFGLGNYAWLQTLVRIVVHYRIRLPDATFTLMQRIMAAVVVGFGVVSGVRLLLL